MPPNTFDFCETMVTYTENKNVYPCIAAALSDAEKQIDLIFGFWHDEFSKALSQSGTKRYIRAMTPNKTHSVNIVRKG